MKTQIYYFSGTGNALYVAKKIQETLGDTELIRITSALRDSHLTIEAEALGFVFPVHAWGPPILVHQFLKSAAIKKPRYLFLMAVHAGGPENAVKRVKTLLAAQELTVDSAFEMTTPSNYVIGPNPVSQEEAKKIIETHQAKLSEILHTLAAQQTVPVPGATGIIGMLKSAVIHPLFTVGAKHEGKKFAASETCNGCGICEKVCAVKNITLNAEKKPVWQDHCIFCMGCINWCPEQAIEHGSGTQGKNRYHNPEITVSELIRR